MTPALTRANSRELPTPDFGVCDFERHEDAPDASAETGADTLTVDDEATEVRA